jgi:hypothetical protein
MTGARRPGWPNAGVGEERRNNRIEAKMHRRRMHHEFRIKNATTVKAKLSFANQWLIKEIEVGTEESQAYVQNVISSLTTEGSQ